MLQALNNSSSHASKLTKTTKDDPSPPITASCASENDARLQELPLRDSAFQLPKSPSSSTNIPPAHQSHNNHHRHHRHHLHRKKLHKRAASALPIPQLQPTPAAHPYLNSHLDGDPQRPRAPSISTPSMIMVGGPSASNQSLALSQGGGSGSGRGMSGKECRRTIVRKVRLPSLSFNIPSPTWSL
ncbi:hypothetical protein BT69DRAFT_1281657 [Atractiella rhizophila]|nr:hypothetical protein BT69DRAFT_1281657 [Atractiella rhizophila]